MRRILALSIALALQAATANVAAQQATVATDAIPPQSLDSALNALSRQTGLQFVYTAQAGNPRTRAVPAGLSSDQALAQLLQGTGLRYRYLNTSTVTIEVDTPATPVPSPAPAPAAAAPAPTPSAQAVDAQDLESVTVVGSY
ncbi:MAG TPA: STN domain-containing protein, partial [Pseudoxanthomonas sp.]|nr:STN domain-containing protein [Pseudoxanthomonas sp.]